MPGCSQAISQTGIGSNVNSIMTIPFTPSCRLSGKLTSPAIAPRYLACSIRPTSTSAVNELSRKVSES
jgi:hypothetical protein